MPHTFFNIDCMDKDKGMPSYPDKYFELAIVDPPWGTGWDGDVPSMTISPKMSEKRKQTWKNRVASKYVRKNWDIKPGKEYFDELFRVSKNQIIWGGNHFDLPQSCGWIFWDKLMDEGFSVADGELAWTSFDKAVKKVTVLWAGYKKGEPTNRIHPTQKPLTIYKFLLNNYAKPGDKILDTHVGSASSIIACIDLGFDVWGYELDEDYYKAATKRIADFESQLKIF